MEERIINKNWREILEKCILIREFEKVIQDLYKSDCIQSPVHLSIGQELSSVLISHFYKKDDYVVGNYRSHGLSLALADNYEPLILELLAKSDGVSGGKAGSMHLSVPEKNLMWTSAIVGSGVPIAVGLAEALKRTTMDNVVSVMFGDGAIEEGCVIESLNISSVFKLPIVFILEDNGLAIHTKKEVRTGLKNYCKLAEAYGIKSFASSFKDPFDLYKSYHEAYNYSREERLPSFLKVDCYRWIEHVGVSDDWDLGYRKKNELNNWIETDIIKNPEIILQNKSFVDERTTFYSNLFMELFNRLEKRKDPQEKDLLRNVY